MKTLIVLSHPNFNDSRLNKALFEAAKGVEGVTVRHLEDLYGADTAKIDVKKEQELFFDAQRVVYLFPMLNFNVPAMLKAYLDNVLINGFAYGEGAKIAGKELQIAVSTGGSVNDYSKYGAYKNTLNEILLPLQCGAEFCGLTYNRIFACGGITSGAVTQQDIAAHAVRFVRLLKDDLEEDEYQA